MYACLQAAIEKKEILIVEIYKFDFFPLSRSFFLVSINGFYMFASSSSNLKYHKGVCHGTSK